MKYFSRISVAGLLAGAIAGCMFSQGAFASAKVEETPRLQATSTIPVIDDRIAALWKSVSTGDLDSKVETRRECTAASLEPSWWITAHHCVAHDVNMRGFLRQSNGQTAGIASIYLMSDHDDVALLKTDDGISPGTFNLPSRSLSLGDRATLTGYGATNEFASSAELVVTGTLPDFNFGNSRYTRLVEARSVYDSRTCNGDSGSPVFVADTIFGIHTAGGYNPVCLGGKGKLMWYTDLFSRVDWIRKTISENSGLTEEETLRAKRGRQIALASLSGPYSS